MIKHLCIFLFVILPLTLLSYGVNQRCLAQDGSIEITSPNGGEIWSVGSKQNITWNSSNVSNVRIQYSTDDTAKIHTISQSVPAQAGQYEWTIPPTTGNNCRIMMVDVDNQGVNDESDETFSIVAGNTPFLYISSPKSGDNFEAGTLHNILWSSSLVSDVKLELSTDNGTSWKIIKSSLPAVSGSYSWLVPNFQSNRCKVKISDVANPSTFYITEGLFTISEPKKPFITLTRPNGGEIFEQGKDASINWIATQITNVRIEITYNGGKRYNYLVDSTPAITGMYVWKLEGSESNICKVFICDATNREVNDESDDFFTVVKEVSVETLSTDFLFDRIFPLPATDGINIKYELNKPSFVDIKLIFLDGSFSTVLNHYQESGSYIIPYNLDKELSGTAILSITAGNETRIQKIIITK